MDSPESAKPGPAFPAADADAAAPSPSSSSPAVVQDSPFFTYVSNLSPIKTVNDGCAPSAFRELNFPSPSPVFTSPHANPIRRGNLLKRCQYASPDSGKITLKYAGNIKQISENMSLFGSNSCLSRNASVTCTMKDSECEFSTELQSCSSTSVCVDEFLADPMEDSIDSCGPSNLCSDQAAQLPEYSRCRCTDSAHSSARDLLQDAETGNNISKKTTYELNPHNKNMKAGRSKARERLGEEALVKNNPSTNISNEDHMIDERSVNQCSEPQFLRANDLRKVDKHEEILADLSGDQNSLDQNTNDESYMVPKSGEGDTQGQREKKMNFPLDHSRYVMQHSTKNRKGLELDHTPNTQTESVKVVPIDNNQHDICGASCNTSAENVLSCVRGGFSSKLRSEGCQYQRGMCKRLEFDSGPSGLENLNASHAEAVKMMETSQSVTISRHALSRSLSHLNQKSQAHMEIGRSIRKNRSTLVSTVPRPSGIGLHLNSVVNVVAMNVHINVQSEMDLEKDNLSASGEIELGCSSRQRIISDSKICLASLSSNEDVSAKFGVDSHSFVNVSRNSDNDQQENQAMEVLSSSSGHLSHVNTNPLKGTVQSELLDCCTAPCNVKLPSAEDACESEELSESSPRKKRKKTSEDGGCKRCNCKKSKCLKLYCDCFAAGVYCADACACQGCLNRPEYEDTVLETRQQIESRNPLAFAPKVVVRTAEVTQTSGEDSKGINPASARHKRGCNCKRSQCLKKYCECFQAKVGCSFGCRCEGCKNRFGKKDGVEAVETEHVKLKDERCKNDPSDCTDVADSRGVKLSEGKLLRHLSPFTPLQACNNGGNVSKTHYAARRYLSSPESSAAALLSHGKSKGSPTNSGDANRFMKVRAGNPGQCLYSKELGVHDADEADLSSPKWEKLAQRCNLRLLSNSSPSEPKEMRHCLRAPISQGSGQVSVGSLVWHNSPITPMPHFGESRLSLESCSDNEPLIAHEDDTPDILKDACVPGEALKMSSPNKKRVSPPHKQVHETRTSSSTSMRSRKFILKSVPSFPSLTPYGNNMTGHGT